MKKIAAQILDTILIFISLIFIVFGAVFATFTSSIPQEFVGITFLSIGIIMFLSLIIISLFINFFLPKIKKELGSAKSNEKK